MGRNRERILMILIIILVVFNVIAFVVPFSKTVVFWIAYIFTTIAIFYQLYTLKIAFERAGSAKSKFYGFPIARVGVIYLIVQFIIGI